MELTTEQRSRFDEDGYLHLTNVVSDRVLANVEAEYESILDHVANTLLPASQAREALDQPTFSDRFVAVAHHVDRPLIPYFEISYPFTGVTQTTPISLGDAVFGLISCPEILDVVEAVLGPEVSVNPVQHTRIKLPSVESQAVELNGALSARTGWHQDLAAVLPDADTTDELTVWVAMTDADEERGCLVYLPGSHRSGLAFHCQPTNMAGRGGSNIPVEYIYEPEAVSVPVRRGDVLIHTMLTKHSSLDNTSNMIRWSFDLRYQRTGQPSGRPVFPCLALRSRENAGEVVSDPEVWRAAWHQARDSIARADESPVFNRWNVASAYC
jgi:ectoine hydroxylase-related dioxygenase (phytanoyl-CoA dioxygenase family)